MNYEERIMKLFKNGYLRSKDVTDANIPRVYLSRLVAEGKIERVGHGLYMKTNDISDDFVVLQNKCKKAVFSNMTALYLYGLSERIPIKYNVTVSNKYHGKLRELDNVDLFYSSVDLLDLGVTNYKLDSGNIIRVYDLDRTICDIIKNKKKLDLELFNKAIREYFYGKDKNILKLYDYAKKMKIYDKVRDTFEVLK